MRSERETVAIEMTSPDPTLKTPLLSAPSDAVIIPISESKEVKKEDIDLESDVKKKLMDRSHFRTLSDQARISIMGAIQIEMSTLQDLPVDQLANALRHLILKNPVLRRQLEKGEGHSLFIIRQEEWNHFFGRGISELAGGICTINPCDNPCLFIDGGESAGECIAILCACISLLGICWMTGFGAATTCSSRESTTTKINKLLLPVAGAVTVSVMMYHFLADSLGNMTEEKLGRGWGEIGGPILAGWLTYVLTSCLAAAKECPEEEKEEFEERQLQAYFAANPVDVKVMEAVSASNIEKLLVEYQREGDDNRLIRFFSREVLDEWILRLETLQNIQKSAPQEEKMDEPVAKMEMK